MPNTVTTPEKSERKTSPAYKYKITEEILKLPRDITINFINDKLKELYNISPATFQRDRLCISGDDHAIPTDRLEIYTLLFKGPKVSPDAMKNYSGLKGKTIVELFAERR